jgi:hypothetical protein
MRHITKTDIINHTHTTFGIKLSDRMKKPQLIVAYQQLTANLKLLNPVITNTNPLQPNTPAGHLQQCQAPWLFTSE